MKNLIIFLVATTFLASCGTNSSAQTNAKSLIIKDIQSSGNVKDAQVLELDLIQELSAKDSMLFLNDLIAAVNEDYSKKITSLKASSQLLAKSQQKLYYENSNKINPYYKDQCDSRIMELKEICAEVNSFSDGLNGIYELNRGHIFKAYVSLTNQKSALVAKIYKAKISFYKKGSVNSYNQADRTEGQKTEIKYFVLNAAETEVIKSMKDFTMLKTVQEQFLKFERYKVDDQGVITRLSNETNLKDQSSAVGETTIIGKYIGSEFIGYCNITFEKENGEQVYFINSDLGQYANKDEICGMNDSSKASNLV